MTTGTGPTHRHGHRPRRLGAAHLAPLRRARDDRRARPAAARRARRATPGRGHVTLRWEPVAGAVGYLVHRAPAGAARDDLTPVDHLGGDVLAVPETWYVDTTGEPGTTYDYAVASVPTVTVAATLGDVVTSAALADDGRRPARSTVAVDASAEGEPLPRPWQPMIGSERLSQLLCPDLIRRPRDRRRAARRAAARPRRGRRRHRPRPRDPARRPRRLPRGRRPSRCTTSRRSTGSTTRILEIGLRPCVELGFMPRDLASDPDKTVFEYRGIISPPKDWDRWADLITRPGPAPDRPVRRGRGARAGTSRSGTRPTSRCSGPARRDEWMQLYDVTAAAVKDVDPRIPVGGPSSAAAGWVDELLEHVQHSGVAGRLRLHPHLRQRAARPPAHAGALRQHGARILWTEWGVTPTHFHPVNDGVSSATFLLHGMRSSAGRLDALSYWVASDHFEELGRPPRLLHGGFGLITVGGIAKSRYHALHLLSAPRRDRAPGRRRRRRRRRAGADLGVAATTTARLTVLVWNHTLDQDKRDRRPGAGPHRPAPARRRRPATPRPPSPGSTRDHGDVDHAGRAARCRRLADRRAVGAAAGSRHARRPSRPTLDALDGPARRSPQPSAVLVQVERRR